MPQELKRPAIPAGLFHLLVAFFLGACFLNMSKNVAMMNQGDFFLASDSLLDPKPIDVVPYQTFGPAAFIWSYSDSDSKPLTERNSAWIYLWMQTKLQRLFSSHFDLFVMALVSKLILLACCYRLSFLFLSHASLPSTLQLLLFLLVLAAVGCAHNIGMVNSFYGEHTFIVFLPVALIGMLERKRWLRMILIPGASLFASAAKPQYFYLAALAAAVVVLFSLFERARVDVPLVCVLLAVSFVSWYFAFHAGGNTANYYNSTYFGSYLRLSDEQLRQLGVKTENLECVGVDPWGNRVDKTDTLKFSRGPTDCAQRIPVKIRDVVAPYLRNPRLLIDMWRWAAPVHFTVAYFHVYQNARYIIPSDGKSFHAGNTLLKLSALRQRFVTPFYAPLILAGIALPFLKYRTSISAQMKAVMLLLALFIPSQFAVSLLGEGVRDLSKHLAAAQFCLDLLCVFLLLGIVSLFRRSTAVT